MASPALFLPSLPLMNTFSMPSLSIRSFSIVNKTKAAPPRRKAVTSYRTPRHSPALPSAMLPFDFCILHFDFLPACRWPHVTWRPARGTIDQLSRKKAKPAMPVRPTKYLSHTPTRREILRVGSLALFGLSAPSLMAARAASADNAPALAQPAFGRAKSCILLFMWGGPAHQDTWDLKPEAPAEIRGEFRPIATRVPGIQICEHLPLLAERADKLAIVRSLTHPNVDHLTATHYLLTGQPPPRGDDLANDWPHVGSVLARVGRGQGPLPPFVSMRPKPQVENDVPRFVEQSHGQFAGWLGQAYNPLSIDADPSSPDYHVGDFALPAEISRSR
jgi:hypothetical protein